MSRHKWLIIALSVAVLTSQGVFYLYQAGAWGKGATHELGYERFVDVTFLFFHLAWMTH